VELRFSLRNLVGVASVLVATAALGCADTSNDPVSSTQIALAVPSGSSLVQIGWVVAAADGSTLATGTQEFTTDQVTLSMNLALPPSRGDVLSLEAVTSDGVDCTGTSAPFDVVPGTATAVNVTMTCQTTSYAPATCATVLVDGPTPAQAKAPLGRIALDANASDPDGTGAISFNWSATAGTFNVPFASSALYTCTTAGAQTIVLTVTDAQAGSSCSATLLLPVTCLP
jgi:hypothetical protein